MNTEYLKPQQDSSVSSSRERSIFKYHKQIIERPKRQEKNNHRSRSRSCTENSSSSENRSRSCTENSSSSENSLIENDEIEDNKIDFRRSNPGLSRQLEDYSIVSSSRERSIFKYHKQTIERPKRQEKNNHRSRSRSCPENSSSSENSLIEIRNAALIYNDEIEDNKIDFRISNPVLSRQLEEDDSEGETISSIITSSINDDRKPLPSSVTQEIISKIHDIIPPVVAPCVPDYIWETFNNDNNDILFQLQDDSVMLGILRRKRLRNSPIYPETELDDENEDSGLV